jgi:hypothetical protein
LILRPAESDGRHSTGKPIADPLAVYADNLGKIGSATVFCIAPFFQIGEQAGNFWIIRHSRRITNYTEFFNDFPRVLAVSHPKTAELSA